MMHLCNGYNIPVVHSNMCYGQVKVAQTQMWQSMEATSLELAQSHKMMTGRAIAPQAHSVSSMTSKWSGSKKSTNLGEHYQPQKLLLCYEDREKHKN
jgi:hypothetical protein